MGLFDNVTSAVNRGTAAANRTSRAARLKMQSGDIARQRRELVAQLGASLYDAVKDRPEFRPGRERLLDGIAALDDQRAAIEAEVAAIEAEAEAAQVAARMYTCPQCGMRVSEAHSFCSGCGLSIASIRQATGRDSPAANAAAVIDDASPRCALCGAPMGKADLFCMSCGAKRAEAAPEAPECNDPNPGRLQAELQDGGI